MSDLPDDSFSEESDDLMFVALARGLIPRELSAADRDRLRARVVVDVSRNPPVGTMTLRAQEGRWEQLAPGVSMKVLRIDETARNRTLLLRMSPGSEIEGHPHSQEEECFVIDGEVLIGSHRLTTGDMHVASPGTSHERITSPAGALLLVRAEVPVIA